MCYIPYYPKIIILSSRGLIFFAGVVAWKYENKQSEIEGGSILTNENPGTMEVFVVDLGLAIYPAWVAKTDWEGRKRVFGGKSKEVPTIIVCRGGWNRLTTYAGFKTEVEANGFKEIMTAMKHPKISDKEKLKELKKLGATTCESCGYMNKAEQFGEPKHKKCPSCGSTKKIFCA